MAFYARTLFLLPIPPSTLPCGTTPFRTVPCGTTPFRTQPPSGTLAQVAKQQVTASGAKADEAFFPQAHPTVASSSDRHQRAKLAAVDAIRRANAALLAAAVDEVTVDRIFNRSVSLSSDAIVDFVTALVKVSEQVGCGIVEGCVCVCDLGGEWVLR
jgi:hypothetical protein